MPDIIKQHYEEAIKDFRPEFDNADHILANEIVKKIKKKYKYRPDEIHSMMTHVIHLIK